MDGHKDAILKCKGH